MVFPTANIPSVDGFDYSSKQLVITSIDMLISRRGVHPTAAAPTSEVEAVVRSPTNMAAAKIAAVGFNKMTSLYRRPACGHVRWGRSANQSMVSNASVVLIGRKKSRRIFDICLWCAQPNPTKGKMRIHCLENVDKSLTFLNEQRVHLENMGAHDIVDGNPRLTLGLIWTIILRFQVPASVESL